jgi:hypothetical protein
MWVSGCGPAQERCGCTAVIRFDRLQTYCLTCRSPQRCNGVCWQRPSLYDAHENVA